MSDFFKFYFLSGSAFLKYYKKKILTSTVLLVISALATMLKDFEYDNEPIGKAFLMILQYGPVVIIAIILLFELISTLLSYFINKPDIIIKKMLFDAYYLANNNYSLVIRNYGRNIGKTSIREITGIREAYYQEPTEISASASLIENDSSSRLMLSEKPTFSMQSHTVGGRNVTVYKYSWNAQFIPPINSKEEFNYAVKIDAKPVEQNVYQTQGTIFSYPLYYTTQEMIITIHARDGFKIKLYNYTVNDEGGNEIIKEKRKLLKPKMIALGTVLQWRIILPKRHLRYNLSYSLEEFV